MDLKTLRKQKGITQAACAQYLGVPLRTYISYENDERKHDCIKYRYMLEKLEQYGFVDEEHGLLTVDIIKSSCEPIFRRYEVGYCYLFGSYAKGTANESSDVDILVYTSITGLRFYNLVEELRECLKKRVDVLNLQQISENLQLTNEILMDGIKIYG